MIHRILNSKWAPHLALIVANIVYGANYSFFASLIGESMSSTQLFFSRVVFGGLFFLPFVFTKSFRVTMAQFKMLIIVAVTIIFGRQLLMLIGMEYTSPIDSSTIATLNPVFILIISAIMLHEKITRMKIAGVIVGALGALMLILGSGFKSLEGGRMAGNIIILISIIFSAYNSVHVKGVMKGMSSFVMMGWYSVIGFVLATPFFIDGLFHINFAAMDASHISQYAYILIIGTVPPSILYYWGIHKLTPIYGGLYAYIQPVVATALAIFRKQDNLDFVNIISIFLIFLGVLFVIKSYSKPKIDVEK